MTGQPAHATEAKKQNFSSGRELIEAVRTRREQAQQAHALLDSLKSDLPSADALDGDRIDGVKVLWISERRAARDETAFRHALATGHRLREAGGADDGCEDHRRIRTRLQHRSGHWRG